MKLRFVRENLDDTHVTQELTQQRGTRVCMRHGLLADAKLVRHEQLLDRD